MRETLKRLQDLQRRLEELHEETTQVLSESQRLMLDVERQATVTSRPAETLPQQQQPAKRPRKRR